MEHWANQEPIMLPKITQCIHIFHITICKKKKKTERARKQQSQSNTLIQLYYYTYVTVTQYTDSNFSFVNFAIADVT